MKTTKLEFSKNGFFIKTILLCAFGIVTLFSVSCSKDDPAPAPAPAPVILAPLQNPLEGYLAASGFNQSETKTINSSDYELGLSFIPLVNGKITAIVVEIPAAHIGMRVTIWDKATGTVLRTESVDIRTGDVVVTKSITPLDVLKDKEYTISFNSDDWYEHRKTNSAVATYPLTVGDLKITSYTYEFGTSQTIPENVVQEYYTGDCSFTFQK